MRDFLNFGYNLKGIADYETGPDSEVSPALAAQAVAIAQRFVAVLVTLIEGSEIA